MQFSATINPSHMVLPFCMCVCVCVCDMRTYICMTKCYSDFDQLAHSNCRYGYHSKRYAIYKHHKSRQVYTHDVLGCIGYLNIYESACKAMTTEILRMKEQLNRFFTSSP